MRKLLLASTAALGLAGCQGINQANQATITFIAEGSCQVINQVAASTVAMDSKTKAALNAGVQACAATNNGFNMQLGPETAAILAAITSLQNAGLVPTALAPEARLALKKLDYERLHWKGL